jgi:hypothetical protein
MRLASRAIRILAGLTTAVLAMSPGDAAAACTGDCDGDGRVAINEIIRGVNIAIGIADLDACAAMDANGDDGVSIDELITAVNHGLDGCPGTGSPTATPSGGPPPSATPTATEAPGLPPTNADDLAVWLRAGDYLDWNHESGIHPSTGPHFGRVRTFLNSPLFASLEDERLSHPAGAAAVKELYGTSGSEVRGWSVSVKLQDASADGNGWYWFEAFDDKVYTSSVGAQGCTGCHSLGRDFVRIPFPLQ